MLYYSDCIFRNRLLNAVAQGVMRLVVPNGGSVVPATLTLYSFGLHYMNLVVRGLRQMMDLLQFNLRHDKEAGQVRLIVLEELICFGVGLDDHFGFERGANQLFSTLDLQRRLDVGADGQQLLPAFFKIRILPLRFRPGERREVHASGAALLVRDRLQNLLGCKRQDRSHQLRQSGQDVEESRLRAAAGRRILPESVEAILQNIEVGRAHLDRAEVVKLMKDDMKLKVFVRLSHARDQILERKQR